MARGGWPSLAVVALVLSTLPTGAFVPAQTPPTDAPPDFDKAWVRGFQDALAWSVEHRDALVAPLVPGAALQGWHTDAIAAYEEGRAWALARLDAGDRSALDRELHALLQSYEAPTLDTRSGDVPDAFVAPMSVLLEAMRLTGERNARLPDADEMPYAFVRGLGTQGAWMFGAIDGVLPGLRAAASTCDVPEPILIDPLGLVILGGCGDDAYNPPTLPARWMRPTLLIEPGGDDTYNIGVAATGEIEIETSIISPISQAVPSAALAIELGGNDTYNDRAARAAANAAILVDEEGNDDYASRNISFTTAMGFNGLALLADRAGDDRYETLDRGIAYAQHGIAVLADWQGDDRYLADLSPNNGFTHAAAENAGSLAVLRDYAGDDAYVCNIFCFASSEDDGYTVFIDDQGDDTKHLHMVGGSHGWRARDEGGVVEAPLNHAPAYYLDGGGNDKWSWRLLGGALPFGNNLTRVENSPDQRWGIFIDCESPQDAIITCSDEQDDVLLAVVTSAA